MPPRKTKMKSRRLGRRNSINFSRASRTQRAAFFGGMAIESLTEASRRRAAKK